MGTISLQIPQSGLFNSTEDPKISSDFTAVQTLLNGQLDTSNLSPTAGIALAQLAAAVQAAMFSPGDLKPTAAPSASIGWLVCDGSPVARATYNALFAVIGTTWGAGDGTNTFNLPDLRGKTVVGAGTGAGLSARALGQYFGAETQGVSVNDHTHVLNTAGGASIALTDDFGPVLFAGANEYGGGPGPNFTPFRQTSITGTWSVPAPGTIKGSSPLIGTTAGTGSGAIPGSTSALQPSAVLNWLIKT